MKRYHFLTVRVLALVIRCYYCDNGTIVSEYCHRNLNVINKYTDSEESFWLRAFPEMIQELQHNPAATYAP